MEPGLRLEQEAVDREWATAVVCPQDAALAAEAERIARAHLADAAIAPGLPARAGKDRAGVVYVGRRTHGGRPIVKIRVRHLRHERALPKRFDLRRHSPTGFEWGYGGSGPSQLALAILAYHAGKAAALDCYQDFKRLVVSGLPYSFWTLTAREVDAALEQIYAQRGDER